MQAYLVDAHLHLQDPRFADELDNIIARAEKRGITRLFCNAVNEADWPIIVELAAAHHAVVPFLGIHPWSADSVHSGWQDRLVDMARTLVRFGGIGETGLDKSCPVDFTVQKASFYAQLELAAKHGWPMSVHCVRAWGPLVDILKDFSQKQTLPRIMIHAYNGSTDIMERLTGMGCYISFSEALENPKQAKLHKTFTKTPRHLVLLETDAPYDKNPAAPHKTAERSFNEPADVAELYKWAAHLLGVSREDLGSAIWKNATVFTD